MQWSPSASLAALRLNDNLRYAIRQWMRSEGIIEVCTPPLSNAANTDAVVQPFSLDSAGTATPRRYLHTSPEFAMKRILAAYPQTDIYQIATVFRAEEQGRYHNSQFSMLEWYRVGMNHQSLMSDVSSMLRNVYDTLGLEFPGVSYCSYCDAVRERLGCWPHELQASQVQDYFKREKRSFPQGLDSNINACLDLFMDEFVLPEFSTRTFTLLTDYPCSQAALARVGINDQGLQVAERFEVYFGAIELANGFHELADAKEQLMRFEQDLAEREENDLEPLPIDKHLLAALDTGFPDCAGVAIGLERLLMVVGRYEHIDQVVCFDDARA